MPSQTKKVGMGVQNKNKNRPANQRPLNFMSLPNCTIIQNLWLCQPVHLQNISQVFQDSYINIAAVSIINIQQLFFKNSQVTLLWSVIKPGEVWRRPKLIIADKDDVYTEIHSRIYAKRICICFNILAAYLSLLSAFGTVLLIHFHLNIPNERRRE